MDTQKIPAGRQFLLAGQPIDTFWYINSGSVQASFEGGCLILSAGSMLGVADLAMDCYCMTYTALEETQLIAMGNKTLMLQQAFLADHPDNAAHLAGAVNAQFLDFLSYFDVLRYQCDSLYDFIRAAYAKYQTICSNYHLVARELPELISIQVPEFELEYRNWASAYQRGVHMLLKNSAVKEACLTAGVLPGYLFQTSEAIHELMQACSQLQDYSMGLGRLLLNEDCLDLFDLLTALHLRIGQANGLKCKLGTLIGETVIKMENIAGVSPEYARSRMEEYRRQLDSLEQLQQLSTDMPPQAAAISAAVPEQLSGSLNLILEYADCMSDVNATFRSYLAAYKKLPDKNVSTPEADQIRKELSNCFFQIYASAFQVSLMDNAIPTVMKMFFNFGYVDAELAGVENACSLYQIADTFSDLPEAGIYTAYHWLLAIYNGQKEPSVTALESDYEKYVLNLLATGKINKTVSARMLQDRAQKVMFELENMFQTACRITNGHLATFCPVLSEHQFIRQPLDVLLHSDVIEKTLAQIRSIDYRLFYHDVMTILSEKENIHDYFHTEILPDIILMPVVGTRGAMWQETSGRSQQTPARMMLPVFELENLNNVLLHMCGEYRWEICKRVQGSHWNDVSEPSLTSLYYDYLQFFRHNNDLSSDAKEKIKISLQKCRQNFREFFIRDYMTYVLYEGNASPRLNKVARSILFTQCPFSAPIRQMLSSNPLYAELLDRHNLHAAQRMHQLHNLKVKLDNLNQPVPISLASEMEYCEK